MPVRISSQCHRGEDREVKRLCALPCVHCRVAPVLYRSESVCVERPHPHLLLSVILRKVIAFLAFVHIYMYCRWLSFTCACVCVRTYVLCMNVCECGWVCVCGWVGVCVCGWVWVGGCVGVSVGVVVGVGEPQPLPLLSAVFSECLSCDTTGASQLACPSSVCPGLSLLPCVARVCTECTRWIPACCMIIACM